MSAVPTPVEQIAGCPGAGQSDMNECARAELGRAEGDLKATVERIRAEHSHDRVLLQRFDLAQGAWLKFREAELGLLAARRATNPTTR
jgi:uncharacterized protein YecT (DUF1311 family)